jgi:hypothetical protein
VSFEAALEAEVHRKQGKRIPQQSHFVEGLFYRETIKYSEQLERYYEVFEPKNVHVIIFDDFKRETAKVYHETLTFLDVEASFQPKFQIINSNKTLRSKHLQQLLIAPSPVLVKILHKITPNSLRGRVAQRLRKLNTRYVDRPALDPVLRI